MTELLLGQSAVITEPEDDAQLVRAARRDLAAFGALYRRHVAPIYRYLYSRVGNAADAQDLTAQVFLEALQGLDRYREHGSFRAWLFTIARHKVCDWRRRLPKEEPLGESAERTGPLQRIPDEHSLSEIWERQWQRAILTACIEEVRRQVKPGSMQVFDLHVLKRRPIDDGGTMMTDVAKLGFYTFNVDVYIDTDGAPGGLDPRSAELLELAPSGVEERVHAAGRLAGQ